MTRFLLRTEVIGCAAPAGHAEAKHNLEQLEQYIKDSI